MPERGGAPVLAPPAPSDAPPLRPRVVVEQRRRRSFARELRLRVLPHGCVVLLGWPIVSVFEAIAGLPRHPLMSGLPWHVALAGMIAGAQVMAAELLAVGALVLAASLLLFSAAAMLVPDGESEALPPWLLRLGEPVLLLLAAFLGVVLELPAALLHPVAWGVQGFTVGYATLLLAVSVGTGALLFGIARTRSAAGGLATLVLAACVTLVCWRVAATPVEPPAREAGSRSRVLFGIDSLSLDDEVTTLHAFTRAHGGAWYEHAVTPGLLTNAVWPSILMRRLPHETGTFFIFQPVDWARSPYHLVRAARTQGLTTFSYFSDQFTTQVGSTAGFDVDASGPPGWQQIATATLKDASILLPVLLPHLPAIPRAGTPPNQSGTFAFDVRAEITAVLTAGARASQSLVAAHLDYLHQARYPGYRDLTAAERAQVRAAPVRALFDLSLHWQYPSERAEPLGLYAWKIRHLQRLLREEIERTRFLDPAKANRLAIFSDHGARVELRNDNFGNLRYHRVVLATFGVPPTRDPVAPFSLLDLGPLVGLPDPSRPEPAEAVVEYTNVNGREWYELLERSQVRPGGEVDPDPTILARMGRRLYASWPYEAPGQYAPSPTVPAVRD